MSNSISKRNVLSGLIWRLGERVCAQGIQFIVTIVIARILSPSDYGLVGLVTVFISVITVFVQSGFGNALIQKKNADQVDFSSVFFFNLAFSTFLCVLLVFVAPWIDSYYAADGQLTPVVRVLSLSLFLAGINSVQQAYVSRKMIFKKFFFATLIGTIISGFTGIASALAGAGLWALVIQQLTNQTIDTLVLWFTIKWRPSKAISIERLKVLFSFGWKLLCSSLIDTIYNNIYSLTIGKAYSAEELGYYNRGKNTPQLVITNINSSIQSVMFAAYSRSQSDLEKVRLMMRRSISVSTFVIFPCMAGMAAVAKPLTVVLLTEKWLPSVTFLQFCCFIYAFWPIHTSNLQAISAIGRSDVYLKLEIIKKTLGILTLILTIRYGLTVMMVGRCINTVIASLLNAIPNRKLLDYSILDQIRDIIPSALLSIFMGLCVYLINLLDISDYIKLSIQIPLGLLIYVSIAKVLKLECYRYVKETLNNVLRR
nr:lipopolysaccharide biosynthesis protein [Ruminococcus sp. OA3]